MTAGRQAHDAFLDTNMGLVNDWINEALQGLVG